MTSLRNRLLAGLVGAVVLVGALGAWLSYRIARARKQGLNMDPGGSSGM